MDCLCTLSFRVSISHSAVNERNMELDDNGQTINIIFNRKKTEVRSQAIHPKALEDSKFPDPTSANLPSVADCRS